MPIEVAYRNSRCEWIDCETPMPEDLKFLHERYEINSLLLDDTTDPNHLPKYEEDKGVKFFLTRENTELERTHLNTTSDITTKLGIFIVDNVIITVHRMKNKSIYETREELQMETNEITVDKIALKLGLKVLKSYDNESIRLLEVLDVIETDVFLNTHRDANQIKRLYKIKRKSGLNARVLNASSEWVNNFKKLNISDVEFTDLQDKYKDNIADFEHLGSQVTNLISMFLALSDQKANQVMKLLAMYSVYFLPITFIAGVYGMNFKNIPELEQYYGYYWTLGLMASIVIVTFIYFRTKKWQ